MKKSVSILGCLVIVFISTFSTFGISKPENAVVSRVSGNVAKSAFSKSARSAASNFKLNSSVLNNAKVDCAMAANKRGILECIVAAINFVTAAQAGQAACPSIVITQSCIDAVDVMVAKLEAFGEACAFLIPENASLLKKNWLKESVARNEHLKSVVNKLKEVKIE